MRADPENPNQGYRQTGIDRMRGCVMILMALDHARDFITGLATDPTDLSTTTPALFATRWVTHFCAPVFVLLAGTSAYLYGQRHGRRALSRFLLGRGLWLIGLELLLIRLAWVPEASFHTIFLQVIWVLGLGMIALAGLCYLPTALIGGLGIALIAGHNLLDPVGAADLGDLGWVWNVLHDPIELDLGTRHWILSYPLLPWLGVMAFGYALGAWARYVPAGDSSAGERDRYRRRLLLGLGVGATLLFVALRAIDGYGDPVAWRGQAEGARAVMSFLNAEKYPPSLLFLLMTLGPALCALALLERGPTGRVGTWLAAFGRTPLFFYLAHLLLLRSIGVALAFARFGADAARPLPGPAGTPELALWATYVAWAIAIAALYPACRWFAQLKARHPGGWLRYL